MIGPLCCRSKGIPRSEQAIGSRYVDHISFSNLIGAPLLVLSRGHWTPAILCDLLAMIDAAVYTTSALNRRLRRTAVMFVLADHRRSILLL